MKIIRTAALIAAATAAVNKAKEYARDNPAQASETLDTVESFLRDRAGPRYSGKVDQGSDALRKGLGLAPRHAGGPPVPGTTSTPPAGGTPDAGQPQKGFDPSI